MIDRLRPIARPDEAAAALEDRLPPPDPVVADPPAGRVHVTEPCLQGREREYVLEVLDSGFISSASPMVRRFEAALAAACGTMHALSVSAGTHALDLLLYAFDLRPGDEVIVPALTFISVGSTVARAGARPVFVDVDRRTLNLDTAAVEQAIGPRTRGVIAVHTFGHPCEMAPLADLCARRGLFLIEDACEALGARDDGQPVGGLGDAAVHSFYANKMITTGNGGAITTDDAALHELVTHLRGYSYRPGHFFWHEHTPFNVRMSGLSAAIGLAQVEQLDALVTARHRIAARYDAALGDLEGLALPAHPARGTHTWWMYTPHLEVDEGAPSVPTLRESLARCGIETRPVFVPLHVQPVLQAASAPAQGPFPNAEWAARTGVNLPMASSMDDESLERVIGAVRAAFAEVGGAS